jgi:hypothetical protein
LVARSSGQPGSLLACYWAGGIKKVVFTIEFRTGQKMLASGDTKVFTAIQAAAVDAPAAYAAGQQR